MQKIRVALIGAGGMANNTHYPSLKRMADVEMCAICDVIPDKLTATAEKFAIPRQYNDYKKMLAEEAPDAVYALMPPHHLFDVAAYCLMQKHNLFIEKPPAITTEQTRQLAILAKKNGCITMTGFQRRHVPIIQKAKELVESKGKIHSCVATFYKFN
ncbi:MAG: Gfo/Idh/MocA family oxidoreductase, partial [Verrucomicrobia bacterium]|nr:Gfo/Idh/MocA family oxidoreductase [Verrucomicrobiota bacterium]